MERDSRVEPPQLVPTQKRGISLKRIFLSSPLNFLYLRDRAGTKRGEQIAPTMLAVSATRKKSNMTVVSSQLNVGLQVLADRLGARPPGKSPQSYHRPDTASLALYGVWMRRSRIRAWPSRGRA